MPLELFRRVAGELRDMHLSVEVHVAFGLFGDGLADPHVCERARILRDALPEATISVNTNGAAFSPARHAALREVVNVISLHVESLRPDVYQTLMAPLRAAAVFPKFDAILEAFPGMVDVSAPVSRLNREELPELRRDFIDRGARSVSFPSLGRRCAEDDTTFRALSFSPRPIACGPEAMNDLIVDCDGLVLACCNDFSRLEPIGDLRRESLFETLTGSARRARARSFANSEHARWRTCSRCEHDRPTVVA